jgi:small-conductance mechanosensitive channel
MGSPAFAQMPKLLSATQPDKKESEKEPKAVSTEQQREITKHALTETQAERDRALAATNDISRPEVKEKYRLLDGLVTRLNSQINLIDEREEFRLARTAAEQKAKSWAGFPKPPPYPVLMVDELMNSVLTARAKVRGLNTNEEILARQVSQFRESAKQAREMGRQAIDELERAQSSDSLSTASWQKELVGLRTRNADAMSVLMALRYEVLGERLGIAGVELKLLERQLAEAGKQMVFSREDLDKTLARLKLNLSGLEQEMESALAHDALNRSRLAKAKQELDTFFLSHGKDNSVKSVALQNELEARQSAALAWIESSRVETEVVSTLIAINKSNSTFWEQRYIALTGADAEKRRAILTDFRKNLERLKPWLEFAQQQLEIYQAAEQEQKARLAAITMQGPLRAVESDLLAAKQLQRELAERQKTAVEQAAIERRLWVEDIERIQHTRSITDRARDGLRAFPNIFRSVWRFELFAIEDNVEVAGQKVVTSRGVTVGKGVGALLLFIFGYVIAMFLGRRIQLAMVARFGIGEHQANVIRRWLMALTIFILLIITLNIARIPLTVFAFLGGALVIGVGFGTQTLIKNFISGILILLERNVKVGDIIDVDGVVGRIVTVDTRASTVLGFDGVETVIPNSMFLENKVTNWTHTNTRLRRIVKVGVAYGSPTIRVRDILIECGNGHSQVLKNPPSEAFFEDFGDNALIFALYFWIDFGPEVNPTMVASDLRFMIYERFAEENISLAFPQRDVHFDSARPLRIEVISPTGSKD